MKRSQRVQTWVGAGREQLTGERVGEPEGQKPGLSHLCGFAFTFLDARDIVQISKCAPGQIHVVVHKKDSPQRH